MWADCMQGAIGSKYQQLGNQAFKGQRDPCLPNPAQPVGQQVAGGARGAGDDDDAPLVGGAGEAVGGAVV